jgi:hypothetical protein
MLGSSTRTTPGGENEKSYFGFALMSIAVIASAQSSTIKRVGNTTYQNDSNGTSSTYQNIRQYDVPE